MKRAKRNAFAGRAMAAATVLLALTIAVQPVAAEGPPQRGTFGQAMTLFDPPREAPDEPFDSAGGEALTLADFRGQVVLLNFWATWCAPCVEEMPSLDRLQVALGGEGLAVVALSGDRQGMKVVGPFYEKLGLRHLQIYLDPKNLLPRRLGIRALPTTLVLDRQGRVVAGLQGATTWDAPEVIDFLRYYLGKDAAQGGPRRTDGLPLKTGG